MVYQNRSKNPWSTRSGSFLSPQARLAARETALVVELRSMCAAAVEKTGAAALDQVGRTASFELTGAPEPPRKDQNGFINILPTFHKSM